MKFENDIMDPGKHCACIQGIWTQCNKS